MRNMRRYKRLTKEEIFEAFNKVRDAFLAADDGNEVDEIISAVMTSEEKLKVGRRALASEYLESKSFTLDEIKNILKMGKSTLQAIARRMEMHPNGFKLINARSEKVESEYKKRKYRSVGGSTLIFKRKEYTGIKRKDIKR